jgi:hypothetical protein
MDPLENPYSMGAGNPPPALTGRDEEERQYRLLLGRLARGRSEPSMLVWGLRGVGKTVLLLEFQGIADELGWVAPDPIEVKSDTDFRAELAEQAYQALIRLDRRRALGGRLGRFSRLLQGFKAGVKEDGGLEFSFDANVAVNAASGDLERDLSVLFVELGEVARDNGTGVVFLIDEMQFLDQGELEATAAAMHQMAQRSLPIALVGSGLPQLPGLMVEAKSYAERLFSYPRLDRLDDQAAREALARPAREMGVTYDDAALERLLVLSGNYPAFIQAYGKEVWNTAPKSPITREDVDASAPIVQGKLDDQFFHTRFEKATPGERRYMSAMADLGDSPRTAAAVAERLGYKSSSSGSVHRDSLIKKGLVYAPDHGLIDFTVPHFAAFMRRRYPMP